MSRLFASVGQIIKALAIASVLAVNIQGWFPVELTGLILLSKGLQESSTALQFKSINSLALSLYGLTFTSVHGYWKNHSFDYADIYQQNNVSAFNTLSRFVIAFLQRSKCLLISWLQSSSAVILRPKKIKSVTLSIVSPSICHEVTTIAEN